MHIRGVAYLEPVWLEGRESRLLRACCWTYNGYLFPKDVKMYSARIRKRGMFAYKFEYDILMFEAISHFEQLHFGFMENMTNADGEQ